MRETARLPDWIRARLASSPRAAAIRSALVQGGLSTVCEEARCPNRGECWDRGSFTFLILGDTCTRACRYCAVRQGRPAAPDPAEPERLAEAAARLGCRYAVVTSVTRDDLPDGGVGHYAATVQALRRALPALPVELLVPDFAGDGRALAVLAGARPAVLGHNLETVRRLFPRLRPQGDYRRSLDLLARAARDWPALPLKSGLMAGLGETRAELGEALGDLRAAGVRRVTVGQYLQPGRDRAPVARFLPPAEFAELKAEAEALGFESAACGPLVRSSYRAEEEFWRADNAGTA